MKYIVIRHDGNGEIEKDGVSVENISKQELEEGYFSEDEDVVCFFPVTYLKKSAVRKAIS